MAEGVSCLDSKRRKLRPGIRLKSESNETILSPPLTAKAARYVSVQCLLLHSGSLLKAARGARISPGSFRKTTDGAA